MAEKIETIFVKFSVDVSETRYSSFGDSGQADLEFECPIEVLEQIEFVELFKSLSKIALRKFIDLKNAKDK